MRISITHSWKSFKKVIFYMDTNGHMTLTFFCVLLCVVAITFCALAIYSPSFGRLRQNVLASSSQFIPLGHWGLSFYASARKMLSDSPQLIDLFFFCCHKIRSISHSSLRKTKQYKRPKNFVCFLPSGFLHGPIWII